jgi:Ni/Fe-hydrogenase 1 B-type cytochrome subunit
MGYMFTQINVWLDTVFVILWIAVVLFLIFHFVLFITTGRFRKAFIEGNWPKHDHRPPATPKVLHAIHMFSMIGLAITGMYIRFPFFYGGRVAMRNIHYVLMIIVTVVLVWRILYAFMSKKNPHDWKEFAIGRKDIGSAVGVLKYYGYMSNEKPHVAKYNVLQKMSYNMFLYMMIFQALTGFALVTTPILFGLSPRDALVGWWLGAFAGGTDLAGWGVRTVHYILNWLFIIMSTVHLYLAFSVDIPCALDFFGIKPMDVYPDEGHGHDDTHEPELKPAFEMDAGAAH